MNKIAKILLVALVAATAVQTAEAGCKRPGNYCRPTPCYGRKVGCGPRDGGWRAFGAGVVCGAIGASYRYGYGPYDHMYRCPPPPQTLVVPQPIVCTPQPTVVVQPTTVVQQPVAVATAPVVVPQAVQKVWVPGRYVDKVEYGLIRRCFIPGHYEDVAL